jgi:hypothetical protein
MFSHQPLVWCFPKAATDGRITVALPGGVKPATCARCTWRAQTTTTFVLTECDPSKPAAALRRYWSGFCTGTKQDEDHICHRPAPIQVLSLLTSLLSTLSRELRGGPGPGPPPELDGTVVLPTPSI